MANQKNHGLKVQLMDFWDRIWTFGICSVLLCSEESRLVCYLVHHIMVVKMGFDTMMAQQLWLGCAAVVRFVNSLLIDDMGLMEFSVSFTSLLMLGCTFRF